MMLTLREAVDSAAEWQYAQKELFSIDSSGVILAHFPIAALDAIDSRLPHVFTHLIQDIERSSKRVYITSAIPIDLTFSHWQGSAALRDTTTDNRYALHTVYGIAEDKTGHDILRLTGVFFLVNSCTSNAGDDIQYVTDTTVLELAVARAVVESQFPDWQAKMALFEALDVPSEERAQLFKTGTCVGSGTTPFELPAISV